MPVARKRNALLDARAIERVLNQLAKEVAAFGRDSQGLVLVGIQRRGAELAQRLSGILAQRRGQPVATGALDITLYRDDLQTIGPRPVVGTTHLPAPLDGQCVVIVDDVLFTGRTVRAALDELADFGRPARIGLCVLVDRGGRELPIQADMVGKRITAAPADRVDVLLTEVDGRDAVELVHGR